MKAGRQAEAKSATAAIAARADALTIDAEKIGV